ncbi:MAG: glycine cleavage system protein H [Candidatus Cloacimonetes bacterium 4572_65]|nr:MAG: glycine cleavage system protein H [Candidatus Cloacimonetes bacterium 4572_65]
MELSKELYYTETHEWVKVDGNEAFVGITEFATHELGDIVFVELPEVGAKIEVGESIGSIEAVKAVEDINSPVTGEILEVNAELEETPDLMNKSPFGDGWIMKVVLDDIESVKNLLSSEEYQKLIEG